MLSRTAENLYWTGRYMERAENLARLLDVSFRAALLPAADAGPAADWQAALDMLGITEIYKTKYGNVTQDSVIVFLTLDTSHPFSIKFCIDQARENARALRATLSAELWESLNITWLEMNNITRQILASRGPRTIFDWVKERSHLFRGVAYSTLLHNDAFHFLRLGTHLERADNTARLLAAKERSLASLPPKSGTVYYQWGAVLRSVSAFRAYTLIYRDVIDPVRVAELLILKAEMPRSLRFCLDQIAASLDTLAMGRDLECRRIAMETQSRLTYSRIEHVESQGIDAFLTDTLGRVNMLGIQIGRDFLMTV
ncbi:MAG: alpha-E domain-containing protein [Alphaproteobacteria bacterium]|nr:alpha-E domain-containing protein [Alphaproteobacteria bacterium]MBF0354320.1 alpha-E domain-containing protein [Alphaproteobacteria bacterium]